MEINNSENIKIEETQNDEKPVNKYKGKYKEYHQKRYQENKDKYKDNVRLRRSRVKTALKLLEETQGIKLKDL